MGRKEGRHKAFKLFTCTAYLHKGVHIVVLSTDILLRTWRHNTVQYNKVN